MAEQVSLTYNGGWRELNELRWSAYTRNTLLVVQTILLMLILWRVW